MTTKPTRSPAWGWLSLLAWLVLLLPAAAARAQPLELHGRWVQLAPHGEPASEVPVAQVAPTGGRFRFEAEFEVGQVGTYVIDFKNSSVIDRFTHHVFDERGPQVAEVSGGIGSSEVNPFLLRHGREVVLEPGRYRLVSELESPFFLANPEPYVDTLGTYRQAIKPGNAVVLLCLGVFLGLGIYYTCLAALHHQRVHAMYALFILGNILYNGAALLAFRELLGWRSFYLISVPILFSNIAYMVFVIGLLDIRPRNARRFHRRVAR